MKKLTVEEIRNVFENNGWEDAKIVCPDGTIAEVSPCPWDYDVHSEENCDYFLIHWDMPWGGADNLEKVVKLLNSHADMLAEQEEDKKKLRDYFEEYTKSGWDDDSWGFYSDWHKDVYGYRPRSLVTGH